MTRGVKNWAFKDVKKFLAKYGFQQTGVRSSHHYFDGVVKNEIRKVTVPNWKNKALKPRTMNQIIKDSGIDKGEWIN